MIKIGNIRLAPKLLFSVVLLSMLAGSLAIVGYASLGTVYGNVVDLQTSMVKAQAAGRAMTNMLSFARDVEYLPLTLTAEQRKAYEAAAIVELEAFRSQQNLLETKLASADGRKNLADIKVALDRYLLVYSKVLQQSRAADLDGATKTAFDGAEATTAMRDSLRDIQDRNEKAATTAQETALQTYEGSRLNMVLLASLGILLVGSLTVALVLLAVVRPLTRMADAMTRVAAGDLDTLIPAIGQKDEVGQLAVALESFKVAAHDNQRLQAETAEVTRRGAVERRAAMVTLADTFERNIGGVVTSVAASATEMQRSAASLSGIAEQSQLRTSSVAAASEQASASMQNVAGGAEELSASISEISRRVSESSRMAEQAVLDAGRSDAIVGSLATAAGKIGDVVKLISNIASQTNLLALNATIEAARAGDAGKGFAVVASEVKALANQTADATDEIAGQVAAIQGCTDEAVAAIRDIGTTIVRISEISSAIAAAVEEQGAATQEIARNVQQAAVGASDVSGNISGVMEAASQTGAAAGLVLGAAAELAGQSASLSTEVDQFLRAVRQG